MKKHLFFSILSSLVALGGCEDTAAPTEAVPAEGAAKAAATDAGAPAFKPMHTALMDQNFDYVTSMMDALVAGDQAIAQQYGARLAAMKPEPTPNQLWNEGLMRIPTRAQPVKDAKDFATAAHQGPVVLTACAQCHSTIAGPKPYPPDDPPVPFDADKKALKKIVAKKQLEQHQWAYDRLFDGVYYPDPVSWEAGVKAWKSAIFVHPEEKKKTKKKVAKLVDAAQAIDLAGAASLEQRANAFGSVVATCTGCHAQLKVKVRTPPPPEPVDGARGD